MAVMVATMKESKKTTVNDIIFNLAEDGMIRQNYAIDGLNDGYGI